MKTNITAVRIASGIWRAVTKSVIVTKTITMYMLSPAYRYEPLLMLPPRDCLSVRPECFTNVTNRAALSHTWMEITNYICYVLLPMVLFWSLVGQIVNIVILCHQIRLSLDNFLLGFCVSSLCYTMITVVMILPHYAGQSQTLTLVRYYALMPLRWTSYTGTWILISAGIERALTFTVPQRSNSGTSRQTWIIISMVAFIGCISALPVMWEYKLVETNTNQGATDSRNSTEYILQRYQSSENFGFHLVYFWYISSLFVYLPYFLIFVTCISLKVNSKRTWQNFRTIYKTRKAIIFNRKVADEIATSKLVQIVLLMYVATSAPLTVFRFLSSPIIALLDYNSTSVVMVENILAIWYHLFYVVQQQLYFCYNKQYRLTLLSICCCGCQWKSVQSPFDVSVTTNCTEWHCCRCNNKLYRMALL